MFGFALYKESMEMANARPGLVPVTRKLMEPDTCWYFVVSVGVSSVVDRR